ncbi:hypothetical protein BpHYR1_002635 [Brachionus plicatilis]|uniref:Uncharacterized protein n=1 Tax=Brachionus plicatilis TaxID=10195 RepID=A0A3M7QQZ5_BRAPC|nr:hypothetical protein BpHYR1_002635 [Brachionus plicatilis]
MFPIVDSETFVEFAMYISQRIGPIRYFRILDEKARPDTVLFVKFFTDQDNVKLFDYIFESPRETIVVEYPKMLVYMRSTRSTRPKWCRLVKPRGENKNKEQSEERLTEKSRPLDAAASEKSEGIAVAAESTGGETQVSGTDSAIGQPHGALGPGATPKRGNCVKPIPRPPRRIVTYHSSSY